MGFRIGPLSTSVTCPLFSCSCRRSLDFQTFLPFSIAGKNYNVQGDVQGESECIVGQRVDGVALVPQVIDGVDAELVVEVFPQKNTVGKFLKNKIK